MVNINIPKIRILETADQGFGHFFCKGEHEDFGMVIVEVYLKSEGASLADISEFGDQIGIYRHLKHPNISKYIVGGELSEGGAYLALEMEDEIRLADRFRNNEWLNPREATALIIDLARALEAIHKAGLIHGEMRPSNILFNPETGHVKIRNVSRYKDEKNYVLKMVSRRPEYAAPEQIRFLEIDHRTDMYPLGIIFYQMLMGKLPFDTDSVEDIWRYHLEGSIPLLSDELLAVEGLQEVIIKLFQRRKKMRYETDKELIDALENVYDHLFVEEESSMGRIATLENSIQERSEKKKKGKPHFDPKQHRKKKESSSRIPKVEKKTMGESKLVKPGWKQGERRKLQTDGNSKRIKQIKEKVRVENQEPKKPLPKGPLIFSGVAVVVLLVITRIFFSGSDDIEEPDYIKNAPTITSTTPAEPKPEPTKAEPRPSDPKPKATTPKPTKAPSKKEPAKVVLPEKFDSKLDEVKAYAKLPPKEAIEKIKLFLDDEDNRVRMLAVQVYQSLKHDQHEMSDAPSDLSKLDLMKAKLEATNKTVPLTLMDELKNDNSEDATEILVLALDNQYPEVREKAMATIRERKSADSYLAICKKLVEAPEDEKYFELFVLYGLDYLDTLKTYLKDLDDQEALLFVEPLVMVGGEPLLPLFRELASSRAGMTLHLAMEMVQMGEKGIDNVIGLFDKATKRSDALTYLSALREANLTDAHTSQLLKLLNGNLDEGRKNMLIRLLALRKPELDLLKNQKSDVEQQAVTLMLISEMKDPPDDIELRRLVDFLGIAGESIDDRIVSTLKSEGARSHRYLIHAIRKRLGEDIKLELVEIMASHGDNETLKQLLGLIGGSSTLSSDVQEIIYQKLFLSGDKLIPIILASSLNLKEKVNLFVDINSEASKNALITFIEGLKTTEFKKAFSFLMDKEEKATPFVEEMLTHTFEEDIQILILKGLEKEKYDLDLNLYINHMNHENSKVREVVYDIYETKLEPIDEMWWSLYEQAKHEETKLFIIKIMTAGNPAYSQLIYAGIVDEDETIRLSVYQKVSSSPLKIEEYTYAFTNRLYQEESKKAHTILINHLLKKPGGPSLPYCIWSKDNGSRTIKKVTDPILTKIAGNLAKVEEMQGYLLEDYVFELRVSILKFLNQIKVDYLPFLLQETNLGDKESLELIREAVKIQSTKSASVLLNTLSQTKNTQLKNEIESLLKSMNVEYRLDPASGKYILK